ncbi:unnamed protein product [Amoebophrya sp. A120]|nr:unnamed protein product [Amoebophrya sp. A120]|eukprot:GSA120T00023151001.1
MLQDMWQQQQSRRQHRRTLLLLGRPPGTIVPQRQHRWVSFFAFSCSVQLSLRASAGATTSNEDADPGTRTRTSSTVEQRRMDESISNAHSKSDRDYTEVEQYLYFSDEQAGIDAEGQVQNEISATSRHDKLLHRRNKKGKNGKNVNDLMSTSSSSFSNPATFLQEPQQELPLVPGTTSTGSSSTRRSRNDDQDHDARSTASRQLRLLPVEGKNHRKPPQQLRQDHHEESRRADSYFLQKKSSERKANNVVEIGPPYPPNAMLSRCHDVLACLDGLEYFPDRGQGGSTIHQQPFATKRLTREDIRAKFQDKALLIVQTCVGLEETGAHLRFLEEHFRTRYQSNRLAILVFPTDGTDEYSACVPHPAGAAARQIAAGKSYAELEHLSVKVFDAAGQDAGLQIALHAGPHQLPPTSAVVTVFAPASSRFTDVHVASHMADAWLANDAEAACPVMSPTWACILTHPDKVYQQAFTEKDLARLASERFWSHVKSDKAHFILKGQGAVQPANQEATALPYPFVKFLVDVHGFVRGRYGGREWHEAQGYVASSYKWSMSSYNDDDQELQDAVKQVVDAETSKAHVVYGPWASASSARTSKAQGLYDLLKTLEPLPAPEQASDSEDEEYNQHPPGQEPWDGTCFSNRVLLVLTLPMSCVLPQPTEQLLIRLHTQFWNKPVTFLLFPTPTFPGSGAVEPRGPQQHTTQHQSGAFDACYSLLSDLEQRLDEHHDASLDSHDGRTTAMTSSSRRDSGGSQITPLSLCQPRKPCAKVFPAVHVNRKSFHPTTGAELPNADVAPLFEFLKGEAPEFGHVSTRSKGENGEATSSSDEKAWYEAVSENVSWLMGTTTTPEQSGYTVVEDPAIDLKSNFVEFLIDRRGFPCGRYGTGVADELYARVLAADMTHLVDPQTSCGMV